jgi:hypothetical protein
MRRRLRRPFSRSLENTASSSSSAASASSKVALPAPSDARAASPQGTPGDPRRAQPTINARERDLLGEALCLLEERERAIIQANILSSAADIESALGDIFKAAQEKQKICYDKRWTFTVRGRTVRLLEEADKVVLWLDRFKQVGDIVNASPIHTSLPWAGIRLLLEVWRNAIAPLSLRIT